MDRSDATLPRPLRPWLLLSLLAASLALAGSAIALADQRVYDKLTAAFLAQALAQDLVDLVLVAPAIIVLAAFALRGSTRAFVLWYGALLFTAYNYVIYTVAVPFGQLFPLWVAVLGMSIFALLGGAAVMDRGELVVAYGSRRAVRASAWTLIVVALLFGALWLSEDIPALVGAILVTPVVQAVRGEAAHWSVAVPIGTVTIVVAALLVWLLSTMTRPAAVDPDHRCGR